MSVIPLRPQAAEPVPASALDLATFRQVTAALTRCAAETASGPANATGQHGRLADAIHANMALWGAVLHEMVDGRRELPEPLRTHLVELAEVSIRHCSHVLRGDAAIDPLIAVNRSIIEGLQQPTGGKQAAGDR